MTLIPSFGKVFEDMIDKNTGSLEQVNEYISDISREIEHIYTELSQMDLTTEDKHYYQKRLEFLKEELEELKEEKSELGKI